MNPTDLARERWKPYRQAQERAEKAADKHAQAREDLAALEAKLPVAEREDSLALGRALLDGKPEPQPTAAKLRDEIAAQQRRANALEAEVTAIGRRLEGFATAAQLVETGLAALRIDSREEWEAAQTRAVEAATARVDEATAALADEEALLGWVRENVTLPPTAETLAFADGLNRIGYARAAAANHAAAIAHHNRSTPASDAALAWRVRLAEIERQARR